MDEADSALRITGHTLEEIKLFLADASEITPDDIQRFQRLDPQRGVWDTISTLLHEEPQQVPLYYVLARLCANWFGDTPSGLRAVSALMSLLAIPGIIWLGRELWANQRITLTALALWAVSPFFIRYAQDARDYNLWCALTLLASASLLNSLRTGRGWWIYGLLITLGLYTKLLFLGVVGAHMAFVATNRNCRTYWKQAGAAWTVSLLLLSVWIGVYTQVGGKVGSQLDWVNAPMSLYGLVLKWFWGMGLVVCDLKAIWIGIVLLPLTAWGLFSWWWSGNRQGAWLVFLLIAANALPLVFADLIFGGHRSAIPKFLVAAWIGEILFLAWIAAPRPWLVIGLIALGITADLVRMPQKKLWNKYHGNELQTIATFINTSDNPVLVISPNKPVYELLTISYMLGPHVRLTPISKALDSSRDGAIFRLINSKNASDIAIEPGNELVAKTTRYELWRIPRTSSVDGTFSQ